MNPALRISLAAAAVASAMALTAPAGLAEIIFDAPFLSTTGGELPRGMGAGDLNEDGKVDLVTAAAYPGSGELSVNLGLGNGRFASPVDYPCGTWCTDLAMGDVNGDGKLDVVTGNSTADVSLLLGNGDGTLGPNVEYATYSGSSNGNIGFRTVLIADLNGDGRGDVIVTNPNSSVLSIFPGNANGTIGPRVDLMASSSSFVLVADFNHDGRPDIVSYVPTLSLRLNNGSFSFGAGILVDTGGHTPLGGLGSAAAGDFNHDGNFDLAFLAGTSGAPVVGVCLGNGDGTFGPAATFAMEGTMISRLAAGDFDGDGKIDLAAIKGIPFGGGLVALLRGHGNGTFDVGEPFASANTPSGFAVVDVNGDGRADLAITSYYGSGVGVLLGNAAGGFGTSRAFSVGTAFGSAFPHSVAVGDVNHDGIPDIATISGSPDSLALLLNDGGANFPALLRSPIEPSESIALADFDGDGIPDLLTENPFLPNGDSDSTVTLRHGNGNGTFGPPARWFVGRGPQGVQVADVNHDGNRDLVVLGGYDITGGVRVSNPHQVIVALGNGIGTFQPPVTHEIGADAYSFAVGDLDHDGNPDVVHSPAGANRVGTAMGAGDGTFTPGPSFDLYAPGDLALGDVNEDGLLDLAIEHGPGDLRVDSVAVMLGAGDGSFTPFQEFPLRGDHWGLGFSDFDRDGHLDLAMQTFANALSVWSGHGDGTFARPITDFGLGDLPQQVAIADLNGDLLPDIVAVNRLMNNVQVLVNRTTSGSTAVPTPPGLEAPTAASLALAGTYPNPARGNRLMAAFSLAGRTPARLELFDLAGRRLVAREVGAFGAGSHRVDLAAGRHFAPGLYLLRLTQSGVTRTARVAVLE